MFWINFNDGLTTWPRSPSMLCQRASLCPAETERRNISKLQRGHCRDALICRVGSPPANASLLSHKFIFRGRTTSSDAPRWNPKNSASSWPSYSPLASSTTQRHCLLRGDLQRSPLYSAPSPYSPVSAVSPYSESRDVLIGHLSFFPPVKCPL